MICQKCGTSNLDGHKFCGGCATELTPLVKLPVPGEDGAYYCARHKKTVTRLSCGRCEKPVCPRCMVQSPAGLRCRDCSRHRVGLRAGGMLHEAGRVLENSASTVGRSRVWYLALWYFIMSLFRGFGEW